MAIEWYPGHMAKARREIAEAVKSCDLIIEIVDARLPAASANPLLTQLRGTKPCIKVLNKQDLADPEITREWVRHLEASAGVRGLPLEAKSRLSAGQITKLCRRLVPHRCKPGKSLRALIVGIPNVGKSTLINTLAGRSIARVGDRPAITTCQQQIDLRNGILLFDTPGLLWPDMRNQLAAYRLATSGAIGANAYDSRDVGLFAAAFLAERYPERLLARYRLETLPPSPIELLTEIGRRRGCLVGGGEVDLQRAAELLLRELRAGTLGPISLERPGEEELPVELEADAENGL
ncbi:Ribosome biogenesis GTPase A [Desulfuromonas sp. DDH964]|uniref:ribosome biogenesis GTPase YlqF n=1 Tax=Desulfuromonas sp. DDH964 TaxID=1823759 RepID=UPI00078BABA8|nr:ribosome biogenesis GTPase YlqF [Desulfuromonas sp. DDH964]AMV71612.1 Ribosome biogenesis GTPase A [Desulfuromonas sp. DDH964]